MIDAVLIRQCADKALKPAVVEMFIERAGAQDPLAITVRSGNRVVLVPKPVSADEAMDLIRQHIGRDVVRVGITQYPAGLGLIEAGELKSDLVDACANIRMGTALFAKVYRIVTKWYGNPTDKEVFRQVFDDAIIAWQTGYFEGTAVFRAAAPGEVKMVEPPPPDKDDIEQKQDGKTASSDPEPSPDATASDPNKAGIRVDLSDIGARRP